MAPALASRFRKKPQAVVRNTTTTTTTRVTTTTTSRFTCTYSRVRTTSRPTTPDLPMQLQCTAKLWRWSSRAISKHCRRPSAWVLDAKRDESTSACICLDIGGGASCQGRPVNEAVGPGRGKAGRVREEWCIFSRVAGRQCCLSQS